MTKCVICKKEEATQKHHICYDPEIILDVCVPCHIKLHKHGVGLPKGATPTIIEEPPEITPKLPTFTKEILNEEDKASFIVTIDDEAILNWMICPNGCKSGWELYQRANQVKNQFILRCPHCGYDLLVERVVPT